MKKLILPTAILLAAAGPASADIQHLDDVIITFSLCVGNDCVNGESFGFDTVRLKENNLRIHFDDTSTSASFPANDWRIVANDTSNGGDSYLAIEDSTAGRQVFRVDAGAPANSLRVDSGGDVGIGTSNPVVDLHVKTGNTPTMRLEQDGSSGFTAQTWDVAGNEANFFIRDVTNGSKLSFRIRPGAPESSIDIAASGDVGIGTSSPGADFDITRSGQVTMQLKDSAGQAWQYVVDSTGANEGFSITRVGSGTREFRIDNSGNVYVAGTQVHPDYVFEPDYPLMPLQQLAEYVKQHKRLPDVQSAAEVQKQGLNLTALQTQLLKKVEELTLYTLDQDATITGQNEAIASQNKVIAELATELRQLKKEVQIQNTNATR